MLVNVLESATNLKNLELKIKDNSPDDVKCLFDQMKHISGLCRLTLHCSSPAIKVLLSGLVGITVSVSLMLSFEKVDAEGVLALGSGLELHTNTDIAFLGLISSSIGLEGATGLANGLRHLTKFICHIIILDTSVLIVYAMAYNILPHYRRLIYHTMILLMWTQIL